MSAKNKEKFLKWHRDQVDSGVQFDFQKEMEEYCTSDVTILREAGLSFRRIGLEVTMNPEEDVGGDNDDDDDENDPDIGDEPEELGEPRAKKPKAKFNGVDPFK